MDWTTRCQDSRWENEPERERRLSGAPPHRNYVKSGKFLGTKTGVGKNPTYKARKPRPPVKLPTKKPGAKPGGYYKPAPKPRAFNPMSHTKHGSFGRLAPINPTAFKPAMSYAGLRMLGRFARPLPLTMLMLLLDVIPQTRDQPEGYDMIGNGWTLWCDNGLGPLQKRTKANSNPGLPCGTGSQVPNGNYGVDYTLNPNTSWVAFGRAQLGGIRMRLDQQWTRPGGNPDPLIWQSAKPPIWGRPPRDYNPWPQLDPDGLPIHQPVPVPMPVPYPMIPHRLPHPMAPTVVSPDTAKPVPQAQPKPLRANQVPSFVITITNPPKGGKKPVVKTGPGRHVLRKPKTREREKKQRVIGINNATKIGKLIGFLTEFSDMIDVFWKSLPKSLRQKYIGANRVEKLGVILQNLDKLAPGTLAANALSDIFEDAGFGKLGKIAGKAARKAFSNFKSSVGLQTGPADTPPLPGGFEGPDWIGDLDQWLGENVYNQTIGNTSWKGTS